MLNYIKERIYKNPLQVELNKIEKLENKIIKERLNCKSTNFNIPEKVNDTLKKAFNTAFDIVFSKGTSIIEKTYNKSEKEKDFLIRDFIFNNNPNKKEIKKLKTKNINNIVLSTAEGVGLGLLGIGLPDIVLFVGMILKGVYEISIKYGIDYNLPEERMFILKLLQASMQKEEEFIKVDNQLNDIIKNDFINTDEDIKNQITKTSNVFADEMLIMKFIQGLPIIGIIGGLSNPVYYNKIISFVELKYRKRYLYKKLHH